MTLRFRHSGAMALACIAFANSAFAVEPDAPEALITQAEAFQIGVRLKLDALPPARQYGEQADRNALAAYYASRSSRPLWIDQEGLTNRARKILKEIARADTWGLDASHFNIPTFAKAKLDNAQLIEMELRTSLAILKYARHARGGRMDPKQLSIDMDRTPALEEPKAVISSLSTSADPVRYLQELHPQHPQFVRLRAAYLKVANDITKGEESIAASTEKPTKKPSRKQNRNSKRALSNRLLYNMEMWRWMPRDLGSRYVAANIPEYKIRVMDNEKIAHEERIVVGKIQNKTPIFSDEMERIVFHPFWGVPNSIKVKELLPSLLRGGNILEKQGLRMKYRGRDINPRSVDWAATDIRKFHVYQPPSRRNALGIVKFMFPNKHAIYFHDTPSKHLFKKKARAYSHGCMRVRDPLKFAEVLLARDKGWRRSKIDSLVKAGPKNNQISLSSKVPVHIMYFTAWVDDEGKLTQFKDIYGHERLIRMGLEGKTHLIVKQKRNLTEARRRVVSRARPTARSSDRSWQRQVFGN